MNKRQTQEHLQNGLRIMRGIFRALNLNAAQLDTAERAVNRLEAGIVELADDAKWDSSGNHIGPWWWETTVN